MENDKTSIKRLSALGPFLVVLLIAVLVSCSGILMAETDRNENGIPDSWELKYTRSITGMSATAHSDGDGVNNLDEFLAGTDPTNKLSFFSIKTNTFSSTGLMALTWTSSSNRIYAIEWTTNLMRPYSNLVFNLNSKVTENTYTDFTHVASTRIYYRMNVQWTGSNDVMTCLNCHNTNLGSSTAVVLDFTNRSHHVQGHKPTTNDCLVCHEHGTHKTGSVVLKNADTPAVIYTLTGNPLSNKAQAATLSPFCLSCHDANGANGSMTPFGDGERPVDRSTYWANSAHAKTNGVANLSCYGDGKTFGCHATTHGSTKTNMLAPYNVAFTNVAQEEEGFCFGCHDGYPARKSITNEFTKTYRHPVSDGDTYRVSQPTRLVECVDCHNSHAAQTNSSPYLTTATSTRNKVGGPMLGVSGWAINYTGMTNFGAPPNANYSVVTNAVYMYQICFKCHAAKSWNFATLPPKGLSSNGTNLTPYVTDLAQSFSPMNKSGHPVVTGLTFYASSAPKALLAGDMKNPWKVNMGTQTMDCVDCHNTDSVSPEAQGPHGSAVTFMRRNMFTNAVTTSMSWPNVTLVKFQNSWCWNCHNDTHSSSGITGDHDNYYCYECHIVIPHGGRMSRLIGDRDSMPVRYAYSNNRGNMQIQSFIKGSSYKEGNCQAACDTGVHGSISGENW